MMKREGAAKAHATPLMLARMTVFAMYGTNTMEKRGAMKLAVVFYSTLMYSRWTNKTGTKMTIT
jgi:hypothetical protein